MVAAHYLGVADKMNISFPADHETMNKSCDLYVSCLSHAIIRLSIIRNLSKIVAHISKEQ